MLAKEEARQIALDVIGHLSKTSGFNYVILEDKIREHPLAWIFPFNSDVFAATRDQQKMVLGIAPLIVKRTTGEVRMGTPVRFENSLERFLAEDDSASDSAPAR